MFGIKEVKLTNKKSNIYHIGENCLHGTVKVTVHQEAVLKVQFYNYKTNELKETGIFDKDEKNDMIWFLEDRMSHYYADKIINDFFIR